MLLLGSVFGVASKRQFGTMDLARFKSKTGCHPIAVEMKLPERPSTSG